jgi:hypothetical protein
MILLAAAGAFCIVPLILMQATGDLGLIGLAVMGQNLILNMNDHGFTVVAYNRTTEKVDHFLAALHCGAGFSTQAAATRHAARQGRQARR